MQFSAVSYPRLGFCTPTNPTTVSTLALELFDFVDVEQKIAQILGEHVFIQLKSVLRTEIESLKVLAEGTSGGSHYAAVGEILGQ